MTKTVSLWRPITGIYTTEHSVDTSSNLALELAFRNMDRDGVGFDPALVTLGVELSNFRFHIRADEMEAYKDGDLLDYDVLQGTRYNQPIAIDDGKLKFPSATAATLYRQRWAICPKDDVLEVIVDEYGEGFRSTLDGVVKCLTVNNGYGRSDHGGYLKHRFDWSFAGLARLASFFNDGRERSDRVDYWHYRFVDVARIGLLAVARGVTFPPQSPYDRKQAREGGFIPYLELFRKSFPDIAEEFQVGKGLATRIESLFTLPGYLLALYAIGEGERVRAECAAWKEAFLLGEKVLERRKELVTEMIVDLDPRETTFGLDHVPGGAVGLFLKTDEHVGNELWNFLRRPIDGRDMTPFQETFLHLLLTCMDEEVNGEVLDADERASRATTAMLSLGRKDHETALLHLVERHVSDLVIRVSLQRLVLLSNCPIALFYMRTQAGHGTVLTNRNLGMKIDLRKAVKNLNNMERALVDAVGGVPCIWHAEGSEISGRFHNHMAMTGGSGKVSDGVPSRLDAAQTKKVLRLTVGVIH